MTIAVIHRTAGEICQLANRKARRRERITSVVLWALCLGVHSWLLSNADLWMLCLATLWMLCLGVITWLLA